MLPIGVANKAEASNCCIRSVLSNVTGKWRMIILLALEDEPKRFGDLKRRKDRHVRHVGAHRGVSIRSVYVVVPVLTQRQPTHNMPSYCFWVSI